MKVRSIIAVTAASAIALTATSAFAADASRPAATSYAAPTAVKGKLGSNARSGAPVGQQSLFGAGDDILIAGVGAALGIGADELLRDDGHTPFSF